MSAGVLEPQHRDAYASRLRTWNSSPTYQAEVRFLLRMLDPKPGERILDVGCGTGACLEFLRSQSEAWFEGYDVNRLVDGHPAWYRESLRDAGQYEKIYLLHALAHIADAAAVLGRLVHEHLTPTGRLYVLTPNDAFTRHLRSQPGQEGYVPDPTVRGHFSLGSLSDLLTGVGLDVTVAGYLGRRVDGHAERLFAVGARRSDADPWPRTF